MRQVAQAVKAHKFPGDAERTWDCGAHVSQPSTQTTPLPLPTPVEARKVLDEED